MRPQTSPSRAARAKRPPIHRLSDPMFSGLLERDFDDEHEFEYEHGQLDNIDRQQSHHAPWDIEDDGQEFYNRKISDDLP